MEMAKPIVKGGDHQKVIIEDHRKRDCQRRSLEEKLQRRPAEENHQTRSFKIH